MDYQILKLDVAESIGTITVSRPEAMNALNTRFFNEMDAMVAEIEVNDDIKVVIITGEGKAFVAGADIAEMVDKNQEEGSAFSRLGQNTFNGIENLNKPVIAAINGFALGGGLEFAMSCDFRFASNRAKFGQPEVNLGLIPGYAGTQRLSRLTGLANALYLLYTADMISADEAFRIGLVQKITEPEELMNEAIGTAKKIISKGPLAIKKMKNVVRKGFLSDFATGCELEANEFGSLFGNEGEEGMRAFLEKRKPNW